jgi:hypothetical protein
MSSEGRQIPKIVPACGYENTVLGIDKNQKDCVYLQI